VLIGLLSDTHDDLDATIAAMRVLRGAGAEFFIHAGDLGSDQILDVFAGDQAAFVFGNNDFDRRELARYSGTIGVQCLDAYGEITVGGKLFAVTHGDDPVRLRKIQTEQRHDYLITGHTHIRRDEKLGRIRWINPGALHRTRQKTVAVLDPATDVLKFLNVAI